jgi:hypothetical protein
VLDQKAVARIRALEHSAVTTQGALVALITRKVAAAEHRLAGAIAIPAHAIAGVLPRVGRLERRAEAQAARLTKVEKATVGIGTAALVLTALNRLKLGWLLCPALLRMGRKHGCGGFHFLEALLAPAFEALLILDLCQYAQVAQKIAREAAPELGVFLLVQNAVCLAGGASLPSAHDNVKAHTRITLPSAV